MATLVKMREEFYHDMDQLGEKRAQFEREAEKLAKDREELRLARASMADVVAKEMALTFESFVRDMLRPQPQEPAAKPPAVDEQ